jgi:hypothetical protein
MSINQIKSKNTLDNLILIDGLKKYSPGEIPEDIKRDVEEFLFPINEYSSKLSRQNEIKLNQKYLATTFVYFHKGKITATWKSISKDLNEKLPVEFSRIKNVINSEFQKSLIPGEFFSVYSLPGIMPTGEIGGLRIDPLIDFRLSHKVLSLVLETCEEDCFLKGLNSIFLTCMNSPQLKRLYREKFGFHEVSENFYNENQLWTVMIRKLNPLKLEHFTKRKGSS